MQDDVPFAQVLEFLERHGYNLSKRRKYIGEKDAGFVIFARAGSPSIGFPVRDRKVAYEHYQALIQGFEGSGTGEEENAD